MLRNSAINLVLKIGLGLTCIGFALCSLIYPNIILEFYPQFVPNIIGDLTTLIAGSIASLFMAAWIFSHRHKFACFFTFLILIFLAILANLTSLRFVSVAWPLLIISLALAIRYYPRVRIIVPHKDGERMRIVPIIDEDGVAPLPTMAEIPPNLENDPAQTSEFLNSEKFVRGNKFFEDERLVTDEVADMPAVDSPKETASTDTQPTAPIIKPKRAYKSRTKSVSRTPSRKSDHSEIHEEF